MKNRSHLALATSAQAADTICAVVKGTPDGFLVFREKPDVSGNASLLARADEVIE